MDDASSVTVIESKTTEPARTDTRTQPTHAAPQDTLFAPLWTAIKTFAAAVPGLLFYAAQRSYSMQKFNEEAEYVSAKKRMEDGEAPESWFNAEKTDRTLGDVARIYENKYEHEKEGKSWPERLRNTLLHIPFVGPGTAREYGEFIPAFWAFPASVAIVKPLLDRLFPTGKQSQALVETRATEADTTLIRATGQQQEQITSQQPGWFTRQARRTTEFILKYPIGAAFALLPFAGVVNALDTHVGAPKDAETSTGKLARMQLRIGLGFSTFNIFFSNVWHPMVDGWMDRLFGPKAGSPPQEEEQEKGSLLSRTGRWVKNALLGTLTPVFIATAPLVAAVHYTNRANQDAPAAEGESPRLGQRLHQIGFKLGDGIDALYKHGLGRVVKQPDLAERADETLKLSDDNLQSMARITTIFTLGYAMYAAFRSVIDPPIKRLFNVENDRAVQANDVPLAPQQADGTLPVSAGQLALQPQPDMHRAYA